MAEIPMRQAAEMTRGDAERPPAEAPRRDRAGVVRERWNARNSVFAAISISLFSISLSASAQNQDDRYRNDVEAQYRYREASQAEVEAAYRRLSDIYQRRIAEARDADGSWRRNERPRNWYSRETALRASERNWILYRDADCRYVAQPYVGQRRYDGVVRGCLVDRTNERISALRQSPTSFSGDPRGDRWRERYSRTYDYSDDGFYQECRNGPDPAAVIAGGLIGGLIGNAAGRDGNRTGGTIAGIVVGAALGAIMTNNIECDDRSYAYRSYYDGLNSNRPNSDYDWRNQRSGNSGRFHVDQYYTDPDGFRCASYRETMRIDRRQRESSGHACQQPDGVWVLLD